MSYPLDHINQIAKGRFPAETREWLTDLVNECLRNREDLHIAVSALGKLRRDQALRKLWEASPEHSHLGKASAILSRYRRFGGRDVPGRPDTALYAELRWLDVNGYPMPGSARQISRICEG